MIKTWKVTLLISLILCLGIVFSVAAYAAAEKEPNNTQYNAQKVAFGVEYKGMVHDTDNLDDEDYYRIPVKEGQFYKLSVYGMADTGIYKIHSMMVKLCKESDTDSGDSILSFGNRYAATKKLFRATYTGNYYLRFYNTSQTKYSFKITKYNPVGKKVKDSNSNTYKLTGNRTAELSKVASKQNTDFYFREEVDFKRIGNIDVLNNYATSFSVTSIGNYAFKNCNIESISIPKTVKRIGVGAFMNCRNLGSEDFIMGVVIYGKKVVIEKSAFSGCKQLDTLRIIKGGSIKSVAVNAFKGTKKGFRLEVPNIKKYKVIFKNAGLKNPEFSKAYM